MKKKLLLCLCFFSSLLIRSSGESFCTKKCIDGRTVLATIKQGVEKVYSYVTLVNCVSVALCSLLLIAPLSMLFIAGAIAELHRKTEMEKFYEEQYRRRTK